MSTRISNEKQSSPVTSVLEDEVEQTFTFNSDGSITSPWIQPEMVDVFCAICGKRCKELRKPLCVNANPYCG
jgi:hypothetical protein